MAVIKIHAENVNRMLDLLDNLKRSVTDYRSEIGSLRKKALAVESFQAPGGLVETLQESCGTLDLKLASIDAFDKGIRRFALEAEAIDIEAAELINRRKNDFYSHYPYLKPDCETVWLERSWGVVCRKYLKPLAELLGEHWKAIVTVALTVAAVLVLLIPGAAVMAVLIAKAVLVGASLGGFFGGWSAWTKGGNFWIEVWNGAFNGAVYGLLFAGMSGMLLGGLGLGGLAFAEVCRQEIIASALVIGTGVSFMAGYGASLISDLGDNLFRGANISAEEMVHNAMFAGAGRIRFSPFGIMFPRVLDLFRIIVLKQGNSSGPAAGLPPPLREDGGLSFEG